MAADFTHHYNAKLNTCFYLLTVSRRTNDQDNASSITLAMMLFDVHGDELYAEFLGPATIGSPPTRLPATCRVENTYCGSKGEWEVLVGSYMEQ